MAADSDTGEASAKRPADDGYASIPTQPKDPEVPEVPEEPPAKRQRRAGSEVDEYFYARRQLVAKDKGLNFDSRCRSCASPLERRADAIVQALRLRDDERVYGRAPGVRGHGGQMHLRFAGDHYLSNVDLINQTALLDVARRMPKGAHLHIHFNACLPPDVLLGIAKGMDRMFISSSSPLAPGDPPAIWEHETLDRCEVRFSICCPDKESPGNIFSTEYQPWQTMRFSDFLEAFDEHRGRTGAAEEWLLDKLVFHDEEVHNVHQTAAGAWERFNARTRMMKGLFNYETAYRRYTRLCLEDFVRDNIQWAEIRPNFMTSNQLYIDDGTRLIDNHGIMEIIIDEVDKFKADVASRGGVFWGVKVIYCTPRSFSRDQIRDSLDECLQFKKKWPQWIAGFDMIGEEAGGHPIKTFVPELLRFRRDCKSAGVDVPFLFHCGETLDMDTDTDGNLMDALLLGAPRIGHGFALSRHPYVMQLMRERGVCLELCPISNEVLGLTPRVSGHTMYELLANNVHCTVNSDNGTMFRSTLSHDFYQVMIGKADMGLAGWKQLILWSIEHACLEEAERAPLQEQWGRLWEEFLQEIVDIYGEDVASHDF